MAVSVSLLECVSRYLGPPLPCLADVDEGVWVGWGPCQYRHSHHLNRYDTDLGLEGKGGMKKIICLAKVL